MASLMPRPLYRRYPLGRRLVGPRDGLDAAAKRRNPIVIYFLNKTLQWISYFLGFDSWRGLGIFLFTTASRTVLGPTQPPIQWVPESLSLGVKRPGREADYSPPSSAEVKYPWSYTFTPPYVFMAWCLVKHRDNFTFTFTFTFTITLWT
jgi:hypothetical protein